MEYSNYPFLMLTFDEKFPRLLVTRRPENTLPAQNVYGAFLPRGMVRRMLDLLERVFKLRPCELDIKGDFDAPCPEYFLHRCLAPCVAEICSRENYLEIVEIVHLLLSNQSEYVLKKINAKIEILAEDLNFEKAAEWRDKFNIIREIFSSAKWRINVSTMNDILVLNKTEKFKYLQLSTLKRGKIVGKLNFQFEGELSEDLILQKFIKEFYKFYAPKQIFVPKDFPDRKRLEENLRLNFGRKINIVAAHSRKMPPTVLTAQKLAAHSVNSRPRKKTEDAKKTLRDIRKIFDLKKTPLRIECFDVAHLAGKEIIAARVVMIDGVLQREAGLVWEFENLSETSSLAEALRERLRLLPEPEDLPDLLIIDGGKAQVNAASRVLNELNLSNIPVVGAVKPPKLHNQITYFLTPQNKRIEFERQSKAHNFLLNLRDAAHNLANETHRRLHSLNQIFKNNEYAPRVQYLLVPTRSAVRGGNAEDLSPIRSLTQAGKLILKPKSSMKE